MPSATAPQPPSLQAALKSQYHAALATLREPIERCPDNMWTAEDHANPVWRIAYHALFYTHFYLQKDKDRFTPWEHHREDCHWFGKPVTQPYTRDEILSYWELCDAMVDAAVDGFDLAAECGFPWYTMGKLEHQIVNIRHIQHHAAQLADRIRQADRETGEFKWFGGGQPESA